MATNTSPGNAPVEAKVKAASSGAGISGALTVVVMYGLTMIPFIRDMPTEVMLAMLAIVAGAITYGVSFVSGYLARHTPRPDLYRNG